MEITATKRPTEEVLARVHALKDKQGMIAVIDPETGDYCLGNTLTEALRKAKERYPGRVFYSVRIGYSFVHEHKGGIKRL